MQIHIHVHHHDHRDRDVLHKIFNNTELIHNQNLQIMATIEQFEAALSRIDAATTDIANDLRELRDQIANQGLPADVEANVLARLEAKATQLEQMAQSPENPVPPVEGENGDAQPQV